LGDVLKAVQSATGASVDSPGFASERVYVKLGPGEPRDILAALLNGSRYDYIMIGSQEQPNSVARVMLTMRQTSREPPASPSAMARPSPSPTPAPKVEEHDTPDETPPDREAPIPPVQPVPGQPPTPNTTPGAIPGAVQQQPGSPPFGQQPKTPEQLLRDLQQMQQQQQQQLQLQQQLQQQNNFSR
jgi:hypothetical protein